MVPSIFCLCSTTILFIQRSISGNKSEGLLTRDGFPMNKATGHLRWQNVNKRKINGIKQTWTLTMVSCGFHAPNVAKLKAVVNVLQRTYFKT